MSPELITVLKELNALNFAGLLSIPTSLVLLAWRLSSRLTRFEVTLSAFVKTNDRDHKRIIIAVEKHSDTLTDHGERIATLEGG